MTVAYNPEDVSYVWVLENGNYVRFTLIESRYKGKDLTEVREMQDSQSELTGKEKEQKIQAEIDLANHIQVIVSHKEQSNGKIRNIRQNRKREQEKRHKDFTKGVLM